MQDNFNTIIDFYNAKKECPFCHRKLKIILTNFIGLKKGGFPLLNCKLQENLFKFYIRYDDNDFEDPPVEGSIDATTNIITFKLDYNVGYDVNYTTKLALESFRKISPHLESYCSNRQCKKDYRYYLSTDIFLFDTLPSKQIKIRPFNLYMEAFNINNLWVQNDWTNDCLNIFNKDNTALTPLKYSYVNLQKLDKERIINKIMMMATFS